MDYLVELYDDKGALLEARRFPDPMTGLTWVAEKAEWNGGFEFVTASCYLTGRSQWELSIT